MPTFRQRPLTWLFVIASICLSMVLPSDKAQNPAIVAMLFGQSFALGGWLVLGHSHRLLRAGAFLAGVLALALLATVKFFEPPHYPFPTAWAASITSIAVLAGAAALMSATWRAFIRRVPRVAGDKAKTPRWQFPVVELFGWTIIVAVASAVMRTAESLDLNHDVEPLVAMLIFSLVAALLIALFLDGARPTGLFSVLIAVAAVAAIFTVLPQLMQSFDREIAQVVAGAYAYVVAWIFVCRLDQRLTPALFGEHQ